MSAPDEPAGGQTPDAWTAGEVRAFLGEYGVRARRLRVQRLESWVWNLVLRVDAGGERFILRRYGPTPADEVRWELALLDHLLAHGFPTMAPRRRAGGDALGTFSGRPAILYPYVEGNDACQDVDPLHAMTETAELIARLHEHTRDLELPNPRARSGTDARRTLERLVRYAGERGVAPDEPELAKLVDDAAGQLAAFAARLAPHARDLPRGVVHHDAHCGNVLFHDGRVAALIDFDDACPGYLVADLAVMLANWTTDRRTLALDGGRAAALVRAYARHRPPTAAERDLLPDFLVLFTLSDAAAYVQSRLEQGAPARAAVDECTMYRAFRHRLADQSWRAALELA